MEQANFCQLSLVKKAEEEHEKEGERGKGERRYRVLADFLVDLLPRVLHRLGVNLLLDVLGEVGLVAAHIA
eukprot:1033085-Rhodomonas_salina.2